MSSERPSQEGAVPQRHRAPAAGANAPDEGDSSAPDPRAAASEALTRARRAARERGLRPGSAPSRTPRRAVPATFSRSGRDGRDPQLLGDQIDRLLLDRGWSSDVAVGAVIGRWPAIVGPAVAEHVTPVTFEGSALTVQADSTSWATQMRLLSSSVLARIEAEAGDGVVTEIIVLGPSAPSWIKGRRRAPGPGPRDTYG